MFITVTVNREAFFETRVAMSEHRLFKNNVTSEKTHPSNGRRSSNAFKRNQLPIRTSSRS
jgi:hypothetical protein